MMNGFIGSTIQGESIQLAQEDACPRNLSLLRSRRHQSLHHRGKEDRPHCAETGKIKRTMAAFGSRSPYIPCQCQQVQGNPLGQSSLHAFINVVETLQIRQAAWTIASFQSVHRRYNASVCIFGALVGGLVHTHSFGALMFAFGHAKEVPTGAWTMDRLLSSLAR